jgi:hypothetical protein
VRDIAACDLLSEGIQRVAALLAMYIDGLEVEDRTTLYPGINALKRPTAFAWRHAS